MTGTHTWFGASPPSNRSRLPVDDVRAILRHELRDCGSWLHVLPVPLEPFMARRVAYDELFNAGRALLDLLRRTLVEMAPTRRGRLEALRIQPSDEHFPFFVEDDAFELRFCDAMARPDVVIGRTGPQFLEFNVSGAFGGPAEAHLFGRAWIGIFGGPARALFGGHDPFAARADLFGEVCAELGLPRAVALVGNRIDRGAATTTRYFGVEVEFLRGRGFDAEVLEPHDLPAGVGPRGRLRFPLALRYFAPADWLARGEVLDPIRGMLDAGCVLFPPESSYLLANKKVLAWVSEGQPWMSGTERRLVDTYVPWTRVTTASKVQWEGEIIDLQRLVTSRRELFVLKRAVGMMGRDVVLGRSCPAAVWSSAVERAIANEDSVVQAYVEPGRYDLEMVDGAGRTPYRKSVAPVLSPCLFGGRGGGCYVRYFPSGDAGVVGVARGRAMENVMFVAA